MNWFRTLFLDESNVHNDLGAKWILRMMRGGSIIALILTLVAIAMGITSSATTPFLGSLLVIGMGYVFHHYTRPIHLHGDRG